MPAVRGLILYFEQYYQSYKENVMNELHKYTIICSLGNNGKILDLQYTEESNVITFYIIILNIFIIELQNEIGSISCTTNFRKP